MKVATIGKCVALVAVAAIVPLCFYVHSFGAAVRECMILESSNSKKFLPGLNKLCVDYQPIIWLSRNNRWANLYLNLYLQRCCADAPGIDFRFLEPSMPRRTPRPKAVSGV